MTALDEVSAKYEHAKREYGKTLKDNQHSMTSLVICRAEMHVWGEALAILQQHRGETIEQVSYLQHNSGAPALFECHDSYARK